MSTERKLGTAYEKIGTSAVKTRSTGINELRLLLLNRQNLKSLNDKGWHKMYEILFRAVVSEKALYLKAPKESVKSGIATRLQSIGYVLRLAVELGVEQLKMKTVKAVYNHILDTLPVSSGGLCEPISSDYTKALASCLGHAAHTEHLGVEEWQTIAEFCCSHLSKQLELPSADDKNPSERSQERRNTFLVRGDSTASRRSNSDSNSVPKLSHTSEALLECLQHLAAVGNAPILENAPMICDILLGFLSSQPSITRVHQTVFATLNHVLDFIVTNNIELVSRISRVVIPVVTRLWETKLPGLKDEMVIFLILCQPRIRSEIRTSRERSLRRLIEDLMEILCAEYIARMDRELLQLDDIELPSHNLPSPESRTVLRGRTIALRRSLHDFRAEQSWATLQLIASMVEMLDRYADSTRTARTTAGVSDGPLKRPRISTNFEDFMKRTRSKKDVDRKLLSLQMLPFLADVGGVDEDDFASVLQDLYNACSDSNPSISSWALISLTSCAFLKAAPEPSHSDQWYLIWQLASRAATTQSTCRAACHLMTTILSRSLLSYTTVSKDVDSILRAIELNGPVSLVDSSLALWQAILNRRSTLPQSSRYHPGERLLEWFIAKWRPVEELDRAGGTFYTHSKLHRVSSVDIINFLSACAGLQPVTVPVDVHLYCGPIGQTYLKIAQARGLQDILFDTPDEELGICNEWLTPTIPPSVYFGRVEGLEVRIIEMLDQQLGLIREKWKQITSAQKQHVTDGMLRNFVGFLTISNIMCSKVTDENALDKAAELATALNGSALDDMLSYLAHKDCGQKQIDGLLLAVSEIVPKASVLIACMDDLGGVFRHSTGIFVSKVSEALNEKIAKAAASTTLASEDLMDIDDGFRGSKNDQDNGTALPRGTVQASCSAESFRSSTSAALMLCSLSLRCMEQMDVCGEFAAYLMKDVPIPNLIMMHPVVHDFLSSACHMLCDEDAANFCEYLAEELLQGYDVERCETSVGLCLDAVNSLCPRWVTPGGSEDRLADCCIAVYEHAVKIGLEKKATSYLIRTSIASLLQHMLKINREYRANHKQTPRTLLFGQLGDMDVRVMYPVAQKLPTLFSQFSLAHHSKLCDEIERFLPQTTDWTEGLAMRIFTLAQLAMTNSSAVSRMVYRIFETGQLEHGEAYAARAMLVVAKSSQLSSQRDLYRLFSPKLVWAWTEHYNLKDFPFRVFGYETLKEMFKDVPDELVAQLLAKGKDDVAEYVAAVLDTSLKELLVRSFAKTIAYGFAWAIGSPPKPGGDRELLVDIRVRKRLGDEQYKNLINENFRQIISNLFLLMVGDGSSQKFLSKDPMLATVSHTLNEITKYGVSERRLNDPLKPFFKVKVILSAIDHICDKVMGIAPSSIWNAPMVTFISRQLLDSLHPARGPVHACIAIRNIKLLVALAGQTVCQGYPLEMLIHGLKRFVVDNTCSEDTVGILRYLLVKGQLYLSKHPTFALGIFLSLLSSLRDYNQASIGQPQPDTQTEQTSVAVARQFHSWLAGYLKALQFTDDKQNEARAFHAIVEAAVGFRQSGNAIPNTDESELLRQLLDDDIKKEDNRLLDDISRSLAFALCCSNFERPSSFREDMFGSDQDSSKQSKSLLRICKKFDVNDGFRLWSARVLGRSYAVTGYLHDDWTQEMEFEHPVGFAPHSTHTTDIVPKAAILRRLKNLLLSEDSTVVGLVEATLEQIIFDEFELVERIEDTIFSSVLAKDEYSALQWHQSSPQNDVKPGRAITACGNPSLTSMKVWIKVLVTSMCSFSSQDPVLQNLLPLLGKVDGLAEELFPYITHILLLQDQQKPTGQRREISEVFRDCLGACTAETVLHSTLLIRCILYLRTQETVDEMSRHGASTKYGRELWLDIDYLDAAHAASTCRMFKTGLLFAEIHCTVSAEQPVVPSELLLEIFRNVDDPDSYYGVDQTSSFSTILKRFEYEGDGWKSLSLRGANLESHLRLGSQSAEDDLGVVDALYTLGMNGLSHSFLVNSDSGPASGDTAEKMFRSAWRLEQWDLPCPASAQSQSAPIYKALRAVNTTADSRAVSVHVDPPYLEVMGKITAGTQTGHSLGDGMRTLAMLVEMEEVLVSNSPAQLKEAWDRLQNRTTWMLTGRYPDVEEMMAMRQATFGSLAKQEHLRQSAGTDPRTARFMEAQALVGCCKMARSHKVLQHALSAATQLSKVVGRCKEVELDITSVATLQAANVLWEEGQGIASIRMLQALAANPDDSSQSMVVGQAKLLAKLGNWVSEARLEKPEHIMSNYLEKAILELRGNSSGSEAGRVFHEFASFCDQQLNNPGNIEDYERALKLRQAKENEVRELEKLLKATPTSREAASHRAKAKTWLAIDDAEFKRLKDNRDAFLEKSVLNYIKCLAACDDYDNDAVRFCALWLAHHGDNQVNEAAKHLRHVASRKFVPLMNQLSSRLLDTSEGFQVQLMKLITRICEDHPYHGIYQILALTKIRAKDQTSTLRQNAAVSASDILRASTKASHIFNAIDMSTQAYTRLAGAKVEKKKDNKPVQLRSLLSRDRFSKFDRAIPDSRIPPPTMHIEPRADCDYSSLPGILAFSPDVSIASGISAPKIIKCQTTDGRIFKMLVKGGNDDLRQDAIMEQVFEQVSVLLQKSRITRQRRLKVRTYKVIPLTTASGVIEFVPNTIPLHDFLLPAHAAYFPRDWKNSQCRKVVADAQNKSREVRIAEFQRVMQYFKPVMHFFFMHRFNGPDEWYSSRLAYTRSTAAISILGYVLGLGDRHGHNILLDEKTGEVAHIDLGVAFEQGRILPIPEVVPFRLTRDIVDGMGITKTEGVFRRCCEFTLEVLRNEAYNITTILDVLRYDPLYSWTISPVRIKRIQETEQELQTTGSGQKLNVDDESEAARALTVVSKKLSKTLSVGATVNELIQQAGDERNLAVLYAGWAAYA